MAPRTLTRRATILLDTLGRADAELSVLLTDDRRIHALNNQFRGIDGPTDVLSFPMDDELLGDIAMSLETARRQVSDRACVASRLERLTLPRPTPWALREEATFLLIHGLLHLLGHDHADPAAEAAMIQEERRLILPFLRPAGPPHGAASP